MQGKSTEAKLIFLISVPRSGSTLLESILATSPEIASVGEAWLMLPLWAMRNRPVVRAIYSHQTAADGIEQLIARLPEKDRNYQAILRRFASDLYTAAAGENRYFLDKTPRYYLIIDFLRKTFPNAKFIFLARNPLSTLSSIIETWYKGHFMWFDHWVDWLEGYRRIASAVLEKRSNEFLVHYERLVTEPYTEIEKLCQKLGVEYQSDMLARYRQQNSQRKLGDPTGIQQYSSVSPDSLEKWANTFYTGYRKQAALRMLNRLNGEDLLALGYDIEALEKGLRDNPYNPGFDLRGRLDGVANSALHILDYRYLQDRYRAWRRGEVYYEFT